MCPTEPQDSSKPPKVAIDAGGSTTLNSSSNEFGTFAFDGTSLTIVESDGMSVGTVGSLDGIAATNTVDISTLTGDLTIASDIATTKGGNSALTLNAGKDAAAGTAAGGNIIVTNSATVAVGSGGTAKLYSGDISDSTGLTNLIGSGSGKFRYNSDESASNFTLALESGVNAIYREQPTVTVTADDASAVYGSAPTLTTSVNSQNGDTVVQILGSSPAVSIGGATSTSGNYIAGDHVLTAAAATDQLGYSITGYTAGTLSVTVKALSLAGSILDKVYDGTDVATSGTSLSGLLSGDVVSLLGTTTFDTKNVGTDKTVTIIGATASGADAANYSIAASGSDTADITVKSVTVSGIAAANRVYDRTTVATVDHSGSQWITVDHSGSQWSRLRRHGDW